MLKTRVISPLLSETIGLPVAGSVVSVTVVPGEPCGGAGRCDEIVSLAKGSGAGGWGECRNGEVQHKVVPRRTPRSKQARARVHSGVEDDILALHNQQREWH